MSKEIANPGKIKAKQVRDDRLSAQLRANLQKRKSQTRSRRTGEADQRPEGLTEPDQDRDES